MNRYYRIMGLRPGASVEEIKKAYRRLALRYHPDRNPQSAERFLQIAEAYEALMEMKRRESQGYQRKSSGTPEAMAFQELMQRLAEKRAQERLRKFAARKRRQQEEEEARSYRQGIYVIGGLALTVLLGFLGSAWWRDYKVSQAPVDTYAKVVNIGANRVFYRLEGAPREKEYSQYVWGVGLEMLAGNGMPLELRHRFKARYCKTDPEYHQIDFEEPGSETLQSYLSRASGRVRGMDLPLKAGEDSLLPRPQAECITLLTYQDKGLSGLAQLYFYDEHPLENLKNSSLTWFFFRYGPTFKDNLERCQGRFRAPGK